MIKSDANLGKAQTGLLKFGGIDLPGRAFLAPMSGITDLGMRRVAARFGAVVVSEMVAATFYLAADEETRLRAEGAGLPLHIVQIAGRDPHAMGEAARLAEAAGAHAIDINMGCPAKRVVGGYAGSALMREPELAVSLVRAAIGAVGVPVSVKMRLGWDDSSVNAPELARRFEAEGVSLVAVHGRTRNQFYKGAADWAAIRAVRNAISIPLVANGDCHSLADARAMIAASGADAVMVGRAAVGRPWLPGDIAAGLDGRGVRALTPHEKSRAANEHYEVLISMLGPGQGVRHARKHLAAYADAAAAEGCGLPASLRTRLVTTDDADEAATLLARCFDSREELAA